MARVYSVAHLLMKCVFAVNNGLITLHPLLAANIFIYLNDNRFFQSVILLLKQILCVFILFLVIVGSISYNFIRRKQIHIPNVSPPQCYNESIGVIEQQEYAQKVTTASHISEANTSNQIDVIEQQEQKVVTISHISEGSTTNQVDDCRELLSEVSLIISNDFSLDEKISTKSSRQLTCYCDGSYSYTNQIGYSGFRASNGFSKYRSCPLRRPRSGSTESEVFAACLALQYAAEYHYDTLILYTDNSKVEQLLVRPKANDCYDYPDFWKAHQQCCQRIDEFAVRVERVRGHTTWDEQRQCLIKREFAKVDCRVRQKRQRHERRYYFKNKNIGPSSTYYSYQYGKRYIGAIHPERYGATLIITASRRRTSSS